MPVKEEDIYIYIYIYIYEHRIFGKIFGPVQNEDGSWRIRMNYKN